MIDYLSMSIIYIIKCKDNKIIDTYIGSSDCMKDRERDHRSSKKKRSGKLYPFVKNNGGWNNFEFFILEQYNAKSKSDLRNREGFWVDKLKPTLNSQKPSGENITRDNYYCECCFHTYKQSTYGNHLKSKKHKENLLIYNKVYNKK